MMASALPEKTLVWCAIRDSVTDMHRFDRFFFPSLLTTSEVLARAGVNSIAVLLWSQGRSLAEVKIIEQFIGKGEQVQKRLVEIRNMPHVGRMWGKGSRNRGRGQRITEVGEKKIRCKPRLWQSVVLNTKNCFIELPFSAFY